MVNSNGEKPHYNYFLLTAREGNVFTSVCQSFCSQSASWLLDHCSSFLRHGQYWNAFLLQHEISSWICFIFVRSDAFKFQPFQKAVSTREEHFAELVQKQKRNVHCKIPHHSFGIFCNYEFNICREKLYVKEKDIINNTQKKIIKHNQLWCLMLGCQRHATRHIFSLN